MKQIVILTIVSLLISPCNGESHLLRTEGYSRGTEKRKLKSGKGGSGKGGKGKGLKMKKGGTVIINSCEGLGELVSDLNTRIGDIGIETQRFNDLTDTLEQTAMYASGGPVDRRILQEMDETETEEEMEDGDYEEEELGQLAYGIRSIVQHQRSLKTGNERVTGINSALLASADVWFSSNANLTDENSDLSDAIEELRLENERLEAERDRLAEQIGSLTEQVDLLSGLVGDQASLNDLLNGTTLELETQITRLEAANAEYERLNQELNDQIGDLTDQNEALATQNGILAGLNEGLNATSQELEEQVGELSDEVDRLSGENSRLEENINNLEAGLTTLGEINEQLEGNVENLIFENNRLQNRTEQLEKANDELETIVSFLDETTEDLDGTVDALTEYLSGQIKTYRQVAVETLQNTYIQRVHLWDCGYRDQFADEPFAFDGTLEIPKDKLDEVITFVKDKVLDELCLSEPDFEEYLRATFQDDPLFTSNHLISGVSSYSTLALNYYFPDEDDVRGLSQEDWADAGFDCSGLPENRIFYLFDPSKL